MKNLLNKLQENKDLQKSLSKVNNDYYTTESFLNDAKKYIQAVKEGRMLCIIESVSNSGMSRNLKFNSCEKNQNSKTHYYRNYTLLFTALGFTRVKDSYSFRIGGCGMDMIFHTNYTIIRKFLNLGIINEKQAKALEQMTPTNL